MAGDVPERDGEFLAGQLSFQCLGAQPPRIESRPLQGVAVRIGQQAVLLKHLPECRQALPAAANHATLATMEAPYRICRRALLGGFRRIERAHASPNDQRIIVFDVKNRPAN